MHVSPPDGADVTYDEAHVADAARSGKIDFVVLTPHLSPGVWSNDARRARWLTAWQGMARRARAQRGVTLIPGVEYGVARLGHFGISGIDPAQLAARGGDYLAEADRAGAFVVVNHPFAVPTKIPGVRASHWDMSYRPWSSGTPRTDPLDAAEIWNVPLSLANVISRPGGASAEERTLAAADAFARRERRPVALVGGTDNHSVLVIPTTWVRSAGASEADILAALAAGATCVGSAEAGSLEAHGDADPEGTWTPIGGRVAATRSVDLRFTGRAEVFVDGVSAGEHEGHYRAAVDAAPHTFRIVLGHSRSGFIYANF